MDSRFLVRVSPCWFECLNGERILVDGITLNGTRRKQKWIAANASKLTQIAEAPWWISIASDVITTGANLWDRLRFLPLKILRLALFGRWRVDSYAAGEIWHFAWYATQMPVELTSYGMRSGGNTLDRIYKWSFLQTDVNNSLGKAGAATPKSWVFWREH